MMAEVFKLLQPFYEKQRDFKVGEFPYCLISFLYYLITFLCSDTLCVVVLIKVPYYVKSKQMSLNLFSCHFPFLLLPNSVPLFSPPLSSSLLPSLSLSSPPLPPSLSSPPLSTAHDRDVWQATFCLQEGGRHYGYREEIPCHLLQGCFLWQGGPCNKSTIRVPH